MSPNRSRSGAVSKPAIVVAPTSVNGLTGYWRARALGLLVLIRLDRRDCTLTFHHLSHLSRSSAEPPKRPPADLPRSLRPVSPPARISPSPPPRRACSRGPPEPLAPAAQPRPRHA